MVDGIGIQPLRSGRGKGWPPEEVNKFLQRVKKVYKNGCNLRLVSKLQITIGQKPETPPLREQPEASQAKPLQEESSTGLHSLSWDFHT